jgi:hypothetical protein
MRNNGDSASIDTYRSLRRYATCDAE